MSEEFHKVRRLPPYVFEQVNRLKASARAAGADIIDLGMGNPDLPTPKNIVDKLCEAVQDPRAHRYSSSKGIPGLRRAQAQYYARRFGVKLNPDTQVVATLGSKEGFANMAQAITAPGDVVLLQRFQLILNRWNRCNYLFLRISERKTGSHFCWKCFKRASHFRVSRGRVLSALVSHHIEIQQFSQQFRRSR
jgi:hypothetical protein